MPKKSSARAAKSTRPAAKSAAARRATATVKKHSNSPARGKPSRTKGTPSSMPVAKKGASTKRLSARKTVAQPRNNAESRRNNELAEYRELLLALRARVRGDVEQMTSEALNRNGDNTESKSPTHLAELGTETYEQDFALRRVENEQDLLDEIDEALLRIANGSYGYCVSCLEAGVTGTKALIPKARLKVIPYARNCVECERKREKWER